MTLDLAAVLMAVALLSVPRILADTGLACGVSATEPPSASTSATAPADAVPSGPVNPVDDEPLVASRDPFAQLVMPEPPETEQGSPGETEQGPSGEEDAVGAPEEPEQPPADMAPVELPEPKEQSPPPEDGTSSENPVSREEDRAPQEENQATPDEAGVSPSDERASSSGEVRPSRPPPPAAAGPERLRLERIAADEHGVARAHLTVAGDRYTPAEGEEFGEGYRLAEIDAPCVRVVRGEERQRVCEDDRVFPK